MAKKRTHEIMVQRLPLTKARVNLGAVIKRVHLDKEYVILEKDGIPVAGLMDIDEFEDYLELQDPKVRSAVKKSARERRAGKGGPARQLLDELRADEQRRASVKRRKSA